MSIQVLHILLVFYQLHIHLSYRKVATMSSRIERETMPAQKEYRLTIQHQPIRLQCETQVREAPSDSHHEHLDEPLIQNYFCYSVSNELVKVTKIKIGSQTVTLMDHISFHHHDNNPPSPQDDTPQPQPQLIQHLKDSPFVKDHFNPTVKKMLAKFESWLKEQQPELLGVFRKSRSGGKYEEEVKESFNSNSDLRESFFRFSEQLNSQKNNQNILQTAKKWEHSFSAAHREYLNDEYLNNVLSEATKSK